MWARWGDGPRRPTQVSTRRSERFVLLLSGITGGGGWLGPGEVPTARAGAALPDLGAGVTDLGGEVDPGRAGDGAAAASFELVGSIHGGLVATEREER